MHIKVTDRMSEKSVCSPGVQHTTTNTVGCRIFMVVLEMLRSRLSNELKFGYHQSRIENVISHPLPVPRNEW